MMNRKIGASVLGIFLGLAIYSLNDFIEVSLMSHARAQERSEARAHSNAEAPARRSGEAMTSPTETRSDQIGAELNFNARAYCRLKQAGTRVPLDGRLKLSVQAFTLNNVDESGETGISVMVQSSECPDGLFSNVRLDANGRIIEERDCRTSTKEELFTSSGRQGNIVDTPSTREKLNLAVSGRGYFVYDCGDGRYLTRSGDFYTDGAFVTSGPGCRVLSRDGRYFEWDGSRLDQYGCDTRGECLALVEPDPAFVEYVDRLIYRAHGEPLRRPVGNGVILFDALETLDDPLGGPIGPYWPALPEFQPPTHCP